MAHAKAEGIDHFHMFAEAYEPDAGQLARFTTTAKLPAALDFAFQASTRKFVVEGESGLSMDRLFKLDEVYAEGPKTGRQLPTFLGNHDMGRFSGFLREADPEMSDEDMIKRLRLANAMMFFGRGVPTVYYGDEQGFVSDGGDRLARENMFPSQTPLYKMIAGFASIRSSEPALRYGRQVTRLAHREDSVFVFSRIDLEAGTEIVVALNAENVPQDLNVAVDGRAAEFSALVGKCATRAQATGSYALALPALGVAVCKSEFEVEP